jgi:cytidylate kinase
MYRVLTVSREYGSGGLFVARRAAEELGWKLLDSALIEAIVEKANVDPAVAKRYDEKVDPWLHRVSRKALWHGAFESVANLSETDVFDAQTMAILTRRVIEEAAALGGCVIVGRGGQCLLADHPDAFHIFIHAPRTFRLKMLRERLHARPDLEREMEATDHQRADYIRLNYGRDMYDRHLYDLMINTRRGIEMATRVVLFEMGFGG